VAEAVPRRVERVRAVGLLSGGLDSALAARLLLDQGIEVIGLHLESPTACRSDVHEVARELGIRLEVRSKGDEYVRLLRHPRFGYGKNMNPCADCRTFMFRLGQPYLEAFDARFLFTGEVVGQRPMSQTRDRIEMIDRASGLEGWVLRPLSARILPETEPEKRGWVDRDRLLGLYGRGRQEQLALADRYGLRHHQSPGGGCLLTDARFSRKLRDHLAHTADDDNRLHDLALLRVGRHFRVTDDLKVVLGRNEAENARLKGFEAADRWVLEPQRLKGPTALVCGPRTEEALAHAVALILRHSTGATPDHVVRWNADGARHERRLGEIAAADLVQISTL